LLGVLARRIIDIVGTEPKLISPNVNQQDRHNAKELKAQLLNRQVLF
jgi:hypothetical protein